MKFFFLFLLAFSTNSIVAQITLDPDNLNWTKIENGGPPAWLLRDDGDNGDGLNDGAMQIRGTANTPALQGLQYLLRGTPLVGEQINLEISYYQVAISYVRFKMQIFNVTDNVVLAETATITPSNRYVPGSSTLTYTFTSASVGDQI